MAETRRFRCISLIAKHLFPLMRLVLVTALLGAATLHAAVKCGGHSLGTDSDIARRVGHQPPRAAGDRSGAGRRAGISAALRHGHSWEAGLGAGSRDNGRLERRRQLCGATRRVRGPGPSQRTDTGRPAGARGSERRSGCRRTTGKYRTRPHPMSRLPLCAAMVDVRK